METINLQDKFDQINVFWTPRIAAMLNESFVKLVKVKGEFMWHKHELEDEFFFVFKGCLKIEMRDKTVEVKENEFFVVKKGTEHKTSAEEETFIMLIEPHLTYNTGDKNHPDTITIFEWV